MTLEIGEKIYKTFIQILHDSAHEEIAKNFFACSDNLGFQLEHLSQEQQKAINDYLDALTEIFETVMTVILEGRS